MAVRLWQPFVNGFRLINGTKLNDLFNAIQAIPAINVGTLTVTGNTTTTGNETVTGNSAVTGNQTVTGTQTVTGRSTFTVGPVFTPNAPVAATGSALASAAQVLNGFTVVTASDGTKCVKLPAVPTPGMLVVLFNSVSGQPLIIFPDAAATINAIGSHGALTCANTVPVILYATSATQWYSIPLLPS